MVPALTAPVDRREVGVVLGEQGAEEADHLVREHRVVAELEQPDVRRRVALEQDSSGSVMAWSAITLS